MKYLCLFCMLIVALVGCTTQMRYKEITPPEVRKLERGQKIYIAMPKDGYFNDKTYTGTGVQVASFLRKGLAYNVSETMLAQSCIPIDEDLDAAVAGGAKYAFFPVIMHWEPRAAVWSGIPTRVIIWITVYDVQTRQAVIVRELTVKGRSLTVVSQQAYDLAEMGIKNFCAELF